MKTAVSNNRVGISPQKLGGVFVCTKIKTDVAKLDETMCDRKFPVFAKDVTQWTADRIEGTELADRFPDGKPT